MSIFKKDEVVDETPFETDAGVFAPDDKSDRQAIADEAAKKEQA